MAEVVKIDTDAKLAGQVGEQAAGLQTGVPQVDVVRPTVTAGTLQQTTGTMLGTDPQAGIAQAPTTGITVPTPRVPDIRRPEDDVTILGDMGGQNPNALIFPGPPSPPSSPGGLGQVSGIKEITPQIGKMDVSQIDAAPQIDVSTIEAPLSEGAQAVAQVEELDPRATVKYQLEQILSGIEEGKPMPPFAAPAVRKVAGIMQARGLGASSMAAAAITQAVMESGVAIAAKDADQFARMQLTNLNNKQKTALQNAALIAGQDKANLSVRLQSAVTNAQSLLATETKNLSAQQRSDELSYNALTQGLFKDAAEENARRQFNAKNELQVEEFFAELGSQVETANANRKAAVDQFNAGEVNAQNQFNTAMRDNREKFNSNMQYAIDQSNVQWRRQVNTADTAVQNETNRINTQNAYNASQNALNNLWQRYRDEAAWALQKTESFLQRQHEVGIMAMEFANSESLYDKQQKDNLAAGIGNWLALWYANRGSS